MKILTVRRFTREHATKARQLVADRDAGATWRELEVKYGLPSQSGTSAMRAYKMMVGGKKATTTFTLDAASVAVIERQANVWEVSRAAALRRIIMEWSPPPITPPSYADVADTHDYAKPPEA